MGVQAAGMHNWGGGGSGNYIDGMRSDGMSYNPDFDPNYKVPETPSWPYQP